MSQPLRLCIVGIKWLPETFIARKLYGLADAGFLIDVLIDQPITQASEHPNIRLRYVPNPTADAVLPKAASLTGAVVSLPNYANLYREAWAAARAVSTSNKGALKLFASVLPILTGKPDIVHFEWNSAAITYLPFYHLFKRPVVISNRGAQVQVAPYNPQRAQLKQGLTESFNRAAAVHCVSDAIRDEAVVLGMNPDKAWVIRPAVDPDTFTPADNAKPKNQQFTIISTGSIIWRKGYEYALVAVRKLVDQGVAVRYQIIGSGEEQQRLLYTIDDLNLREHVHLLGKQTPEQVRRHLQQADVFLLSSLSEGISNAALEGASCALPVVTTSVGGMQEAVRDGVEGFVVPPRDPEAMVAALTKLSSDAPLRQTMGMAGRQRILEQFTLARQIEQFKTMYFSLAHAAG